MEKEEKENEKMMEINDFNDIENTKESEIININSLEEAKEGEGDENNFNITKKDDKDDDDEKKELIKEREGEIKSKDGLKNFLGSLLELIEKDGNEQKTIDEIYEIYQKNEFITKSHIREPINKCLLKFIFFFIGPLYGIIFLIGIFQIKSLMNALLELLKSSAIIYYNCNFKSNCNITMNNNQTNVFDFYDYYYSYSMNETIDFNLMMITGFIGNLLIQWKGFKITAGVLSAFNFGSIAWLLNFDFNFETEGVFDYDLVKILNLSVIYILLLCGVGGSSLLSHQILVESHFKYKDYLIKQIKLKLEEEKKYRISR